MVAFGKKDKGEMTSRRIREASTELVTISWKTDMNPTSQNVKIR